MRFFIPLLVLGFFVCPVQAAERLPTVLIFTAKGRPGCDLLRSEILPSPDVRALSRDFSWRVLDVFAPENARIVVEFQVKCLPSTYVFSPEGDFLGRLEGIRAPKVYASFLEGFLLPLRKP